MRSLHALNRLRMKPLSFIKRLNRIGYVLNLTRCQFWMNRQTQNPFGLRLGDGETPLLVLQLAAGGSQMDWNRVMNGRADAVFSEVTSQVVTIFSLNNKDGC